MKKIDKTILLAEMFGADTSNYVASYVAQVEHSLAYAELQKNISANSKFFSSSTFMVKDIYESINLKEIDSVEEAMIAYGKINYALRLSKDTNQINPLLYFVNKKESRKLGEITMEFDGKQRALQEIADDNNYTVRFKIDRFKRLYERWVIDALTILINPMKVIMYKRRNLPKRKIYNKTKKGILVGAIIVSIMALGSLFFYPFHKFFLKLQNINNALYWTAGIAYVVFLCAVFLLDMLFMYDISRRRKFLKRYTESYQMLIKNGTKIIDEFNEDKAKLYCDVIDAFNGKNTMNRSASYYSHTMRFYPCLTYLNKINHHKRRIRKEEEKNRYLGFFYLILLSVAIIAVIGGLMIGGVLK